MGDGDSKEREKAGKPLTSSTAKLDDSYIVGVLIGRGTYSMVHKCLFKGKKERACKVYKKALLQPNLVTSHVDTLLKLNHPNIVSVHDVFETDTELQVVVDLSAGEDLLERVERSEHYSEREASQAVSTVLSALQYLHSQNIPHGGVFPENLLYESETPKAKLKLSEMAMPKISQSPTSLPIYIAPPFDAEMSSTALKCAADIWSLGILIYIMLCGSEPSLDELMAQLSSEREGEGDEWSEISPSARHLISKCLQRDPSLRLTAGTALTHPWVCGSSVATRHLPDAQERIRTFNARRKLRATTHVIIATQRAMNIVKPVKSCLVAR